VSVTPPKAENTTAHFLSCKYGLTISITDRILAGVATEDPPNFNTFISKSEFLQTENLFQF
jgi:hypothetical protein